MGEAEVLHIRGRRGFVREVVLGILADADEPMKLVKICDAAGRDPSQIAHILKKLADEQCAVKDEGGYWTLTPEGRRQAGESQGAGEECLPPPPVAAPPASTSGAQGARRRRQSEALDIEGMIRGLRKIGVYQDKMARIQAILNEPDD